MKARNWNILLSAFRNQVEISKLFGVSRSFLTDILKKYKETGNVLSESYKCGRTSKLSSIEKDFIFFLILVINSIPWDLSASNNGAET